MTETSASGDPLLRHVPLSHGVTVPVLGIPIRFRSNSAAALDAVHQSFGQWVVGRAVEAPQGECRIILHPGAELRAVRAPIAVRMPDADRLLWHTAGSLGVLDLSRSDAVMYVSAALLADLDHFCYTMLEGMVLVLVAARDRIPLHGAMIARGGVAIILTGPSGMGKSTLAYQALRRGWRVLADDGVYLQTSPALRVWARPGPVLLPEDARRRFPELAGREPTRQASGKLKIPVPTGATAETEPITDPLVCTLVRGPAVSLDRLSAEALAAAVAGDREAGLAPYGDSPARAARMLAARGGWRLTLADDPAAGVELLEGLTG